MKTPEEELQELKNKVIKLKKEMEDLQGEMVNLKAFIFHDGHDLELLYERAKKAYDKVNKNWKPEEGKDHQGEP